MSFSLISDHFLLNSIGNYFNRSLSPLPNSMTKDYFIHSNNLNQFLNLENPDLNTNRNPLQMSGTGIYTIFTASQYSANAELPVRSIEPAYKQSIDEVVRTYMEDVNRIARNMGRFIEYRKTLYGYYKYQPRHSVNYILDLFLIYRKYTGRKMSVSKTMSNK